MSKRDTLADMLGAWRPGSGTASDSVLADAIIAAAVEAIQSAQGPDCRCVDMTPESPAGTIDQRECPEHAYEAGRRHERRVYLDEKASLVERASEGTDQAANSAVSDGSLPEPSGAASGVALTEQERHVMAHACAFDHPRNPLYRNRFCADPGHDDWGVLQWLVAHGLMKRLRLRQPSDMTGNDNVFMVTPEGIEALKGPSMPIQPPPSVAKTVPDDPCAVRTCGLSTSQEERLSAKWRAQQTLASETAPALLGTSDGPSVTPGARGSTPFPTRGHEPKEDGLDNAHQTTGAGLRGGIDRSAESSERERLVDSGPMVHPPVAPHPMLYGSSIVPALIVIGVRETQLGDIVWRAFSDSGFDVKAWNALPSLDREARIAKAIYDLRDEAERAAKERSGG